MLPEREKSMQSKRLKKEYTISGGKKKKDMCEQKRKTNDKLKSVVDATRKAITTRI